MNKVSSPTIYTTQYNNLKGCDFSVSDTEVSRYRSPDSVNMISNDGGGPVKRKGYRKIFSGSTSNEIIDIITWNGNTYLSRYNSVTEVYAVDKVLTWDSGNIPGTTLRITASSTKPLMYTYDAKLYVIVDNTIKRITSEGVSSEEPYVPLVTMGLTADGSGGTSLYDVNILTRKRTYSYNLNSGVSANTKIWLYPEGNRGQKILNGEHTGVNRGNAITVEYLDATTQEWTALSRSGNWSTSVPPSVADALDEYGVSHEFEYVEPYIKINTAPNLLVGVNRDNLRITFKPFSTNITNAQGEGLLVDISGASISQYTKWYADGEEIDESVSISGPCTLRVTDPDEFGREVGAGDLRLTLNGVDYPVNNAYIQVDDTWVYGYACEISGFYIAGSTSVTLTFGTNHEYLLYINEEPILQGLYTDALADFMSATAVKTYGYSSFNRLFFAGGNLGNTVYYTDADNPSYVPDLNYITIGNDDNSVSGLHRKGQYLCAIKENEGSEPTMFLINGALATTDDSEQEYFRVTSTSANIGAYNTKCFATLIDDPMFLTRAGIYGISTISTTSETVLRERSTLLNRKLLAEPNLANAVAFAYDMYYFLICPNGHAYVLDGRQATTANVNGNTDFVYEGYYWEGLPQNVACAYANSDGVMFGTASGRIYKFNTDISDSTAYNDNGQPIHASWSTPMDGDYKPHYLKTMQKKGTMITLEPYERTSCRTTIVKDGTDRFELEPFNSSVGMVDFSNVGNFSYNFYEVASDMFLKKKLKKYKRMQIVVENSNLNEPFGVQEVIKSYTIGSYAKK